MSAWREALTRFLSDDDVNAELVAHAQGRSILDRLMPLEQCDERHADAMLWRGPNCVPDTRWDGTP